MKIRHARVLLALGALTSLLGVAGASNTDPTKGRTEVQTFRNDKPFDATRAKSDVVTSKRRSVTMNSFGRSTVVTGKRRDATDTDHSRTCVITVRKGSPPAGPAQ